MLLRPWRLPRRWKVLFWRLSDRLFGSETKPLPQPVEHPLDPPAYQRRR